MGSANHISLGFDEAKARVGTLEISALLAFVGGFLDGLTYVGHGHVFANAMTGNVVLLGINSLSGSWWIAFRHGPPILAFLAGVSVSEAMVARAKVRDRSVPYGAVLGLEVAVLTILSFLPAATPDMLFTTSIAFAASVQVQTFREVNGQSFNSTFTTGNLRTLSEAAFDWFTMGHNLESAHVMRDFATICLAFLAGAIVGGYSAPAFGNRALLCDAILLIAIAVRIQFLLAARFPSTS